MKVITTIKEVGSILLEVRSCGKSIGLVPTMGALHEGHASLVRKCVEENDVTVVSVFVNPTQFNDKNDLKNYPRTLDADCALLERLGVDIVFAPSVEEIYPEPDTRKFSYPPTDEVMEGAKRPGHFNGVCQIVSKLFYIVQADRAYFGEKDFQQIAVIRRMVEDLHIPVELRPCPIVREASGLAMSSRNTLLSEAEKITAVNISQTLKASLEYAKEHSLEETHDFVVNSINATEGLEVEYFQIVDGKTLLPVASWEESPYVVGCITVYCGATPIRLIDNVTYKQTSRQ